MTQPGGPRAEQVRRLILLAAAVGCAARLAFGFGYWVGKPLTHDELEYLALAENLARGRGLTYGSVPAALEEERFSRPPLYPAFVALVAGGPLRAGDRDGAVRRVKAAQAVVGALAVLLVGELARAAGPQASALAAFAAAIYPPLVWISAFVWSETLYSTLALGGALAVARAAELLADGVTRAAVGRFLLAGALLGAASLARSVGLVLLALNVGWLGMCRSRRAALVVLAAAIVTMGPWSVRTSLRHGRPILVAADGGVNFWIGNHPLARGEGDLAANPHLKQVNRAFREQHAGLSPEALEPLYWREAWTAIAQRPLWWATLLIRKAFYAIVPVGPSYTLHSRRYYATTLVAYGVLLPLAVMGIPHLWRRGPRAVVVFLLAGSTLVTEIVFFPHERYRIPVLDPVLIVCAAAWATRRLGWPERAPCATVS